MKRRQLSFVVQRGQIRVLFVQVSSLLILFWEGVGLFDASPIAHGVSCMHQFSLFKLDGSGGFSARLRSCLAGRVANLPEPRENMKV
jgi:hypothetical protein